MGIARRALLAVFTERPNDAAGGYRRVIWIRAGNLSVAVGIEGDSAEGPPSIEV
jgi:hypothetical protein